MCWSASVSMCWSVSVSVYGFRNQSHGLQTDTDAPLPLSRRAPSRPGRGQGRPGSSASANVSYVSASKIVFPDFIRCGCWYGVGTEGRRVRGSRAAKLWQVQATVQQRLICVSRQGDVLVQAINTTLLPVCLHTQPPRPLFQAWGRVWLLFGQSGARLRLQKYWH